MWDESFHWLLVKISLQIYWILLMKFSEDNINIFMYEPFLYYTHNLNFLMENHIHKDPKPSSLIEARVEAVSGV